MTSRQRFEASCKVLGLETIRYSEDASLYWYADTDAAWKAWQAAERDMLERCMAVCESRITPGTGSHAILMGAANEMKELLNES